MPTCFVSLSLWSVVGVRTGVMLGLPSAVASWLLIFAAGEAIVRIKTLAWWLLMAAVAGQYAVIIHYAWIAFMAG